MSGLAIKAESLTATAFAPFGEVISRLVEPGRRAPAAGLRNLRTAAEPVLGVSRIVAAAGPIFVRKVEGHLHSSQTFIPMSDARFLVVVATASPNTPDPKQFRAFLASPGQGVSYAPGTWHHPLLAIGQAADFATLIWRTGGDEDEQFAEIALPLEILLPA